MLDLTGCPEINLDDLMRLEDPAVIFEGELVDTDGVRTYAYTIGGWLDGRPIGRPDHARRMVRGCLVGGECILVQAKSRQEADTMAADGLAFTIGELRREAVRESVDRAGNSGIITTAEIRRKLH
jgi:hypothetical protein